MSTQIDQLPTYVGTPPGTGIAPVSINNVTYGLRLDQFTITTTTSWANVTGKPSTFPTNWASIADKPSTFPTTWAQIADPVPTDWADITSKPATFPADWTDIANKPTSFPVDWADISNKPAVFPLQAHTHVIEDIYAGAPLTGSHVPVYTSGTGWSYEPIALMSATDDTYAWALRNTTTGASWIQSPRFDALGANSLKLYDSGLEHVYATVGTKTWETTWTTRTLVGAQTGWIERVGDDTYELSEWFSSPGPTYSELPRLKLIEGRAEVSGAVHCTEITRGPWLMAEGAWVEISSLTSASGDRVYILSVISAEYYAVYYIIRRGTSLITVPVSLSTSGGFAVITFSLQNDKLCMRWNDVGANPTPTFTIHALRLI